MAGGDILLVQQVTSYQQNPLGSGMRLLYRADTVEEMQAHLAEKTGRPITEATPGAPRIDSEVRAAYRGGESGGD